MSFTQEQAQANLDEDHANLMTFMLRHPLGRAYIWAELVQCGVFTASFAGERPHTTAFNEGRRDIGLRLLNDVLAFDANALTVMKAEDTERQKRYHVITERDDND